MARRYFIVNSQGNLGVFYFKHFAEFIVILFYFWTKNSFSGIVFIYYKMILIKDFLVNS
jgi:hypothetical protein